MKNLNILLVYYHPVTFDLSKTFQMLGCRTTITVNPNIKDNYGTGIDVIKVAKGGVLKNGLRNSSYEPVPLAMALNRIKNHEYDLVGCDGVFDGDKQVMDVCRDSKIPFFNIQGYPNVVDEPSSNILSLGWFTPIAQYNQKYPSEGHKKQIDWKNISENGQSDMKNICVFYPNFWELKEKFESSVFASPPIMQRPRKYVSLIQGYEKWNKFSYDAFLKINQKVLVENLQGKTSEEVYFAILDSYGLLHLKWADQPGIALFEAMLLERPIFTLRSFVLASMNQEVLIDGYNAIVADSIDELVDAMNSNIRLSLGQNALFHSHMLTDFDRQKNKLERFIERCLNDN